MGLLNSTNEIITEILFEHMDKILTCFYSEENSKVQLFLDVVLAKILENRKQYDEIPTIRWRQHKNVLNSFKVFPLIFDSEVVYEQCVPVLLKILSDPFPALLKRISCEILVLLLRRLRKSEHQEMILRQLLGDY
jgi:hypothetical protein